MLNHPVVLRQLTQQRAAELRAAAAPHGRPVRGGGGGPRRRVALRLRRRLAVLRIPAS